MATPTSLYAALAGIPDENTYLARDPWFQAGQNIQGMQTAPARNSTEAFLLPLIKGLGGGAVSGYGRKSALESALTDIKPAYKSITGTEYQPGPDWTVNQGKVDILAALLEDEQTKALELERQKQMGDLQKSLIGQGIEVNPTTGEYSSNPAILAALGEAADVKERAKAKYRAAEKPRSVDIPAETLNKLMTSKAFIDEGYKISDALENSGNNWASFNAMKRVTGLDKEGLGLRLSNLADTLARARSGAALNKEEVILYNNLIKGDVTGTPKQVSILLRKLVDTEARMGQSKTGLMKEYQRGGVDAVFGAFQPKTPPPNPSNFKSKAEFGKAYDAWKVENNER